MNPIDEISMLEEENNAPRFYEKLAQKIKEMQDGGCEVEVHYAAGSRGPGSFRNSAVLLGRRPINTVERIRKLRNGEAA